MVSTGRLARGIAWVAVSSTSARLIGFATSIILARLLAPTDFGLLAIGLLVINTLGMVRDLGFGPAIIYRKEDERQTTANTAFIALSAVSILLLVVAYASAPYIAMFFKNQDAVGIIRVLSLTIVLFSFSMVPSTLLDKELEFGKKGIVVVIPQTAYSMASIAFALKGYGAWSIVYGHIAYTLTEVITAWAVSDWRPKPIFDWNVVKELLKYGSNVVIATVVIFIVVNIDSAVVGRVLGMAALGYYSIAYNMSNLPATQISHLFGTVMFPAYSKMRDDFIRLKNAYIKALKYVSMLSVPIAFGLFLFAHYFVMIFLGEKWAPAILAIRILSAYGLSRSFGATAGGFLMGIGKPEHLRNIALLQLAIILALIYPGARAYGIYGVAAVVTAAFIIGNLMLVNRVRTILEAGVHEFAGGIGRQFISAAAATLVALLAGHFILVNSWASFTAVCLAFAASYAAVLYATARGDIEELARTIKSVRQ